MALVLDPSADDLVKSYLHPENSLFADGVVGPQVIPYRASGSRVPNEDGLPSATIPAHGLVALNYVRLAWRLEAEGVADEELFRRLISQLTIDDAANITNELQGPINMHVEDLIKVPIFDAAVVIAPQILISLADTTALKNALSAWFSRAPANVQATVFTQSHEIIICLRIPILDSAIYVLLDSHPRDNHPDGPALTIAKELDDIITAVHSMLYKDQVIFDTVTTDKQFLIHCLASKPDIYELDIKDLIDKSAAYLSKHSAAFAASESIAQIRSQAERLQRSPRKSEALDFGNLKLLSESQMTSSRSRSLDLRKLSEDAQYRSDSMWQLPLSSDFIAENPWKSVDEIPILFSDEVAPACHDGIRLPSPIQEEVLEISGSSQSVQLAMQIDRSTSTDSNDIAVVDVQDDSWQAILAQQLQEEEEIAMMLSQHGVEDNAWLIALRRRSQAGNLASSSAPEDDNMKDWQLAVQLQQEFDVGSIDLTVRQPAESASSSTTTLEIPAPFLAFECGVCGELQNITKRIRLPDCSHAVCKECLTGFATTKIDEGRYPIFCPECIAERPRAIRTQVSEEIMQQLDLPEEQRSRLQELQLVTHCISVQCPSCKETMNVDRAEFSEHNVLVCPLPRCGHKWCKCCLKALASSQDRHRCKNGSIERLMKRKGWKYCPGCRTPVQKETGCNHMTCGTPGCNVHFCYKCGVLMIDTTNGGDVGTAVTDHYNECRLFDRRWKCSIQ